MTEDKGSWSQGNQFFFLYKKAWTTSPLGQIINFPREEVEKALVTGISSLVSIQNLITMDREEEERVKRNEQENTLKFRRRKK